MNKAIIFIVVIFITFTSCMWRNVDREESIINSGWKFTEGDVEYAWLAEFDDSEWRDLDLPHDWSIEHKLSKDNPSGTSGGFFQGGIGWYRKSFPASSDYSDKVVYLLFEGIYMNSEVFVNGESLGKRYYGYSSFYHDISPYLKNEGMNSIAVKVDNSALPMDRWFTGAGIYRDVKLIVASPVHIEPYGVFIKNASVNTEFAKMSLSADILNKSGNAKKLRMITHVYHPILKKICVVDSSFEINDALNFTQIISVPRPDLWSPDNPVLYEAITDILDEDNSILDTYVSKFGIRTAEFTSDNGFVLNGEKLMMKGVCLHHDLGCLGAAYYQPIMKKRLEVLKDCGVNAIRLSHNPYSPGVLDLCDELGFVVIDEMYDKWEDKWEAYLNNKYPFADDWKRDLNEFIRRDRSHPSVVLWSVGNETVEQLDNPAKGDSILKLLVSFVHEKDPSRPVTCALHPNGELPSRYMHNMDVVSYNYRVEYFEEWKKQFPEYIFLASETKVYQEDDISDYHELDFSKNTWFMLKQHAAGQFIWPGIDYLGEAPDWPEKGFRNGFISTTSEIKPYGYFTKSIYSDEAMVRITILDDSIADILNNAHTWQSKWFGPPLVSHWNFQNSEKDSLNVFIFSNLDENELFLNGKSLGIKSRLNFPGGVIQYKVPYTKGELKATALDNGHIKASHILTTSGKPAVINVVTEKMALSYDDQQLIYCEVNIVDKDGNLCHVNNIEVSSHCEGPAYLLGSDNGDLSDHSLYTEASREVRDGKCIFIFRTRGIKGEIKLKFAADNIGETILNR